MIGFSYEDVDKWIKIDSSNSITTSSTFLYRIAAIVPDNVISSLLERQDPEALYLGSVLRVSKDDNDTGFTLGVYTVVPTFENSFILTRSNFGLNGSYPYEKYLNSSDYIFLDITLDDVDLSGSIYAQAILAENVYGINQLETFDEVLSSRSVLFIGNKTYEYYAYDFLPVNFASYVPNDVFTTFSVTPSILKLAQAIYNLDIPVSAKKTKKAKDVKKKKIGKSSR